MVKNRQKTDEEAESSRMKSDSKKDEKDSMQSDNSKALDLALEHI